MGIRNVFFKFARFVVEFETSISIADSNKFTHAFGRGNPIMIDCEAVKIHPFGGLVSIGIPFIHEIIFADTTDMERCYLVSSLKEHQEVEVQISSCLFWTSRGLILNLIRV